MTRQLAPFDPVAHADALRAALAELLAVEGQIDADVLRRTLRRYPKDGCGFFSKSDLIAGLRHLAARGDLGPGFELDVAVERLRLKPVRTLSGVAPVTVLTPPFPCPGQCIFCPNDLGMPKSYLADEPGCQRAAHNAFDPYLQTWNRLDALSKTGHAPAKVELIVLGGTWSFYPEAFQIDFVARCFEAMNDFGAGRDRRAEVSRQPMPAIASIDGRDVGRVGGPTYNAAVPRRADGGATWAQLAVVQRANETAVCRNVGLVVETRPDHVSVEEVLRLRRLGVTKAQIGIQSLSDAVLAANKRGHDVETTRRAMRLLRGAGFKLHAHWMPNLMGSNPEADRADFARLFDDADIRPDELKIYPCSLVASAELMRHYEAGEWRPYREAELLDVVAACVERTPRYCRLTRIVRDIPSTDIVAGNKKTNFREIAERALAARGGRSVDIRAREVRGLRIEPDSVTITARPYDTGIGCEVFLDAATAQDRLAGFLRLSLPKLPLPIDELSGAAVIREVHVYGALVVPGERQAGRAQHGGLGARLVEEAVVRARAAGFERLAVISAVGTRAYYRRLGFTDGALYQHRCLRDGSDTSPPWVSVGAD